MESQQILHAFDLIRNGCSDDFGDIQSLDQLATDICKKNRIRTPYVIQFKDLNETPNYNDDIIISPSDPVIITLNNRYILECLIEKRNPLYFRQRLKQALERIHLLQRTLRHPVPLTIAIALRKEAKKWIKIPKPIFEKRFLSETKLEIKYTITVTHSVSGTQITLSGTDPLELKRIAISRISNTILSNQDLMDMIQDIEDMKGFEKKIEPEGIAIGGIDGILNERRIY